MKNQPISIQTKPDEISFTSKVFGWTSASFVISGFVAFKLWQNYYFVQKITENYLILAILVLVFLGFIIWTSQKIETFDSSKITLFFFVYSILNGIILPLIFQFFTQNFIISTFFIFAGMFLVMAVLGNFTKQHLTSLPSLILMFFVGIILNVLLNLVWRNDKFQLISSAIAVLIFVGITAYDSKRIQEFEIEKKPPILGAFALYLDLYFLFLGIVFEANKKTKGIQH